MSTLTIRKLSQQTHDRLRVRAAQHGRSVEAEVRAILDDAVGSDERNMLLALHADFAALGGVELDVPVRDSLPRGVELQ